MAGVFDPASSPSGGYTYTVAGTICPQDQAIVAVSVLAGPNAGQDNAIALCDDGAPIDMLLSLTGTPDAAGTWTDSGGNVVTGLFDSGASAGGVFTYTYTVTGSGACPDAQAVLTITVNTAVSAGTLGYVPLCGTSAPVDSVTETRGHAVGRRYLDRTGWFSLPGVFDPASDPQGVYTYTVTGLAPCASASTAVNVGGSSSRPLRVMMQVPRFVRPMRPCGIFSRCSVEYRR